MATRRGDTKKELTPLVAILGPTASGKSDWVNSFAKKFNGEVVSADSRQIFKDFSGLIQTTLVFHHPSHFSFLWRSILSSKTT